MPGISSLSRKSHHVEFGTLRVEDGSRGGHGGCYVVSVVLWLYLPKEQVSVELGALLLSSSLTFGLLRVDLGK